MGLNTRITNTYHLFIEISASGSMGLIIATLYVKVYDGNQMVSSTFEPNQFKMATLKERRKKKVSQM